MPSMRASDSRQRSLERLNAAGMIWGPSRPVSGFQVQSRSPARSAPVEMDRAVTVRVTGRVEDVRPAGDVERLAVRERHGVGDLRWPQATAAGQMSQEAPRRAVTQVGQHPRFVLLRLRI